MAKAPRFVPCTPAGTSVIELAAVTEAWAWKNLEAQLCPGMYADRKALEKRGYTVDVMVASPHKERDSAMSGQAPSMNRDKGLFGGSCNRTACQKPGAVWWHMDTRAYYCEACAHLLNDVHAVDSQRLYGGPLLRLHNGMGMEAPTSEGSSQ